MHCTPSLTIKAKKKHVCDNCGEQILAGEIYNRWASFDDSVSTNKMHPECLKSLQDNSEGGFFEYIPYDGERPKL